LGLIETIFLWLGRIVLGVTFVLAGLFVLRVILTWVGANPFGRVSYHLTRLTEPMIRPLRYQFGGGRFMRYDLLPLVIGVMILVTGFFIYGILGQFAIIVIAFGKSTLTLGSFISNLIRLLGLFYVVAIFLRFFLPFFGVGYGNRFYRFIFKITEPLLKPLRRFLVIGMLDLSPLFAMFIINILTGWIANMVEGLL
jgi:YggT family protein